MMAEGTMMLEIETEGTEVGAALERDRIAENLACVELHFHTEALSEIERALELYTDDIVWEAPAPNGLNRSFYGKQAVAESYRELFASIGNVQFQPLQRFATEDRVVDDSIVTFEVVRDGYWQHFSVGQKIEMRLVHIFEMRDGKISKEIVFDMGKPVQGHS
jgi:ketosteroid isomerase-like protein